MLKIIFILALSFVIWLLPSCSTVPLTGRSQLNMIPNSEMLQMSFAQYNDFLQKNRISSNSEQTAVIRRIGQRIQKSVEEYMSQNGLGNSLKNFAWEFNLVEDKQINAWCMPGGKVVVYTGIMPVCQNEDGLAVVMGHEIAHAIAEHGNERMSQALLQQLGGVALAVALSQKSSQTQALWMAVYGMGSQVGMLLPFSRQQESEADKIGLVFAAMAGYNPSEAPKFWQRMAAATGGGSTPEFLSTHPAPENRIKNLNAMLPQVMPYYENSKYRNVKN